MKKIKTVCSSVLCAMFVFNTVASFAETAPLLDKTGSNKVMPVSNSTYEGLNQNSVDIMNLVESSSDQVSAKKNYSTLSVSTLSNVNAVPAAAVTGTLQGSILTILGTSDNDNIKVTQDVTGVTVTSQSGSKTYSGVIKEIDIYSFDGDDVINVTSSVTSAAKLYGGAGNDQLFADNAYSDLLDSGSGNDLLVALKGSNVVDTLFGGDGFDSFWTTTNAIINGISADETAGNTVHRISQFYQPFTTNKNSSDYIPLNISGQNLPDPIDSGTTFNVSAYSLFNNGTVYFNDVDQGALGDCYFLGGLASLAETSPEYGRPRPDIILQSIAPLGDGTYGIRFYRNGVANYLRIDGDIPANYYGDTAYTKYAGFGTGNDTWAMLLEKAFAFFRYRGTNTYNSLIGGYLDEPFKALTGLGVSSYRLAGYSDLTVFNFLQTKLAASYAITLASNSFEPADSMIVSSHAYSLRSVQNVDGTLSATVYNPWGVDGASYDASPNDGLLTITMSALKKYFSYFTVSAARIGNIVKKAAEASYKTMALRSNSFLKNYHSNVSIWEYFWNNSLMPYFKFKF